MILEKRVKDLNNALSEVGAKLSECDMQKQLLEKEVQSYKKDQLQQKDLKEE